MGWIGVISKVFSIEDHLSNELMVCLGFCQENVQTEKGKKVHDGSEHGERGKSGRMSYSQDT